MIILMVSLAVAGGLFFGIQGPVNTAIGKVTNSLQGTFTSFAGGTLALILIVNIFGNGNLGLISTAAPWKLCGGMIGMVCVLATIVPIPELGAALQATCCIVGEVFGAILVDSLGLFQSPKIKIDKYRGIGLFIIALGVAIVTVARL